MTILEKIGRVSSDSVFKATGKHWDQWITILEKADARGMSHQEIAAYLAKKYKLRPWWQQGVAHGFEVHTGRRIDGQNAKGLYTATLTKSLPLDCKTVWKVMLSDAGVNAWLKPLYKVTINPGNEFETEDGFFGEVRTLKKDQHVRMAWQDPSWDKNTYVQLHLVSKPLGKSLLVIDHGQIKDLKTKVAMRARWKPAIEDLCKILAVIAK